MGSGWIVWGIQGGCRIKVVAQKEVFSVKLQILDNVQGPTVVLFSYLRGMATASMVELRVTIGKVVVPNFESAHPPSASDEAVDVFVDPFEGCHIVPVNAILSPRAWRECGNCDAPIRTTIVLTCPIKDPADCKTMTTLVLTITTICDMLGMSADEIARLDEDHPEDRGMLTDSKALGELECPLEVVDHEDQQAALEGSWCKAQGCRFIPGYWNPSIRPWRLNEMFLDATMPHP
eukprot:gene32682-17697_t